MDGDAGGQKLKRKVVAMVDRHIQVRPSRFSYKKANVNVESAVPTRYYHGYYSIIKIESRQIKEKTPIGCFHGLLT